MEVSIPWNASNETGQSKRVKIQFIEPLKNNSLMNWVCYCHDLHVDANGTGKSSQLSDDLHFVSSWDFTFSNLHRHFQLF